VFIALSVVQLIGWGADSAAVAGAAGVGGAVAASLLSARLVRGSGLYAQLGDIEIRPQFLRHVVDDLIAGLVVEGAVPAADREGIQSRLATLRKGDPVSYCLITDYGKATAGTASIKGVRTKAKSDGRLLFTIRMRRSRG
jgi:hypothetical protein